MQAASCAWKTGGCVPGVFCPLIIIRLPGFFLSPTSLSAKLCPLQNRKKPQPIQPQNKSNPTENWNLQSLVLGWLRYKRGYVIKRQRGRLNRPQKWWGRRRKTSAAGWGLVTQLALGECWNRGRSTVAPYLLIGLFLYPLFLDCSFSITLMGSHTLEKTYHLKTGSLGLEILTRKMLLSQYQTCSSGTTARTFVMSRTHLTLLSNQEKSELELWRKVFIHPIWFFFSSHLFFFPLHSLSKSLLLGVGEWPGGNNWFLILFFQVLIMEPVSVNCFKIVCHTLFLYAH